MKPVVALVLLLSSAIGLAYYLSFDVYGPGDSPEYVSMKVIEDNKYYRSYEYFIPYYHPNMTLEIAGVYSGPLPSILEIPDTDSLEVRISGLINKSMNVSFCNRNGVCEPCEAGICPVSENFLTCPDCRPSDEDGVCVVRDDGVCDPDCAPDYNDIGEEQCVEDMYVERSRAWVYGLIAALFSAVVLLLIAGIRRQNTGNTQRFNIFP